MKQLSLFPTVIRSAYLLAQDNPNGTFYKIWIEENVGFYTLIKESGTKGKVLNRRKWPMDNLAIAEKTFARRVKFKLNPDRSSPRKYKLI